MEQWEQATPAERQGESKTAICWECGENKDCHEYIVCCTGTIFHVCPACEAKVKDDEICAVKS